MATPGHVDFAFQEPPHEIQIESGGSAYRTVLTEAPGGHLATLGYLQQHGQPLRGAEVARAVALSAPDDASARNEAVGAVEHAQGLDAAIGFLRDAINRRPDDFDLHRDSNATLRRPGRLDEVREVYRARRDADPGSVEKQVLYLRLLPPSASREAAAAVALAHPSAPVALVFAGAMAYLTRDDAACDTWLSRVSGDPIYPRYADDHVASLVALGRVPEAPALAARFADMEGDAQFHAALLYAAVARLPLAGPPPAPPLTYVQKVTARSKTNVTSLFAASVLGDVVDDAALEKLRPADVAGTIAIQRAAGKDPEEAWRLCSTSTSGALESLTPAVAILLAGEFARAGERLLAERMLSGRRELTVPSRTILDYAISGVESADLDWLEPEWRAALAFVRARAVEASGKSPATLYEQVERGDVLRGVVTRARKSWPSLAPPPPPAAPRKRR